MKLVNMKLGPKAREEKYPESATVDRPVYPYGLEVRLDDEALDKLGLRELPEVGTTLMLCAQVDVTAVSERENLEGGKTERHRDLSLQITDLALGPAPGEDERQRRAQTALYGEAKT